jgi:membrane associated rhomboid family serine protease
MGLLMLVLWGLAILQWALEAFCGYDITAFGIAPLSSHGLVGLVFAPMLHVNFAHLAGNTIPLLVLSSFLLLEGRRRFWEATAIIAAVSGLAVWLFGDPKAIYVGASGLVFGYEGYVFMRAWLTRHPLWIVIAIGCALVYGCFATSLVTRVEPRSWLAHLSGFIAGMLAAQWLHRRGGDAAL